MHCIPKLNPNYLLGFSNIERGGLKPTMFLLSHHNVISHFSTGDYVYSLSSNPTSFINYVELNLKIKHSHQNFRNVTMPLPILSSNYHSFSSSATTATILFFLLIATGISTSLGCYYRVITSSHLTSSPKASPGTQRGSASLSDPFTTAPSLSSTPVLSKP